MIEEKYKKMLEKITEDYNAKWGAAGGRLEITEKEALEIIIEDTYYDIFGEQLEE